MMRSIRLLSFIVLMMLMSHGAVEAQSSDELREQVQQLQQENAQLKAQLQTLQAENKRLMVLAGLVEPTDRALAQERKLETQTDASGKVTGANSNPTVMVITGGTRAEHEIHLRYEEGQALLEIKAFFAGGFYRNVTNMELTVDGQPMSLPVSNYRSKRQDFGTKVKIRADDEFVTLTVSREALAQIGKAQSVTGKLGRTTFNLTQDQVALFRALDARLQ